MCCTMMGSSDFEHRSIVGVARQRLRIDQIVEAKMQGAARPDGDPIGPDRLAIGK